MGNKALTLAAGRSELCLLECETHAVEGARGAELPDSRRGERGRNPKCAFGRTPRYPRYYHDVAVFDDRLWVMEGIAKPSGNRNDEWYSTDGLNWYEVPGTPWAPRHAASVFVQAGALWMVAGNNMKPDVWRLQAG